MSEVKKNLCDTCIKKFATCDGENILFGCDVLGGKKTDDNVVKCSSHAEKCYNRVCSGNVISDDLKVRHKNFSRSANSCIYYRYIEDCEDYQPEPESENIIEKVTGKPIEEAINDQLGKGNVE